MRPQKLTKQFITASNQWVIPLLIVDCSLVDLSIMNCPLSIVIVRYPVPIQIRTGERFKIFESPRQNNQFTSGNKVYPCSMDIMQCHAVIYPYSMWTYFGSSVF